MKPQMLKKPRSKGSMKRLLKMIFHKYPVHFFIVVLCILFSSITTVIGSYFTGNILIDVFLTPSIYQIDTNTNQPIMGPNGPLPQDNPKAVFESIRFLGLNFTQVLLVLIALFLFGAICLYFYNFLMSYIAQGVQKEIRDELFSHMQDLPVSYFDSHTHGDIMSIYTNDVDALREMLARALPVTVSSLFTMLSCFAMMSMTDFYLMIVVVLFAVIIFLITKYCTGFSRKYFIQQQRDIGETNGYIEEMLSGQRVIKVFNHEQENIKGFKEHNDKLFSDATKANRYASILMPIVNQLGNLQYAILALIGGIFIIQGVQGYSFLSLGGKFYTFGIISSFLLYSKSFVQPIGQMSMQLNSIALALAGADRIFKLSDEKAETDEGYVELVNAKEDENHNPVETKERTGKWAWKHPHEDGSVSYTWLRGKINLYNVDFGYTDDKIVLHDITLYAEPGQKVAFVGPTGAGKTTITNLLNRFYDIQDGKIRYDDININKIKKTDLRRSLGMVFQDTKLFTGTVMENIRYGRLDATDEEVIQAAKLANADVFINQLPDGYNTLLKNGGASLSQGQRQLLSIARTAIQNPPVLILDEATSSIDSRTEELVQKGMDAIMKGRTVFVIAHRLSTIQNSDVIMVLDHGRIIERGNHESLLQQKGKYYQLYTGNKIESK